MLRTFLYTREPAACIARRWGGLQTGLADAAKGTCSAERPSDGAILVSAQVEKWLKGWDDHDGGMILSACADDFVCDDPYDGRMVEAELAA